MALGIGEGKIDVNTEKQTYGQGEILKGRVILQLNSQKKARALRIRFYGECRRRTGKGSSTERIYLQELILDQEKEYPAGMKEYDFQFQLPTIPKPQTMQGSGIVEFAANVAAAFLDPYANVKWYLDASLDIPMGIDVNKRQILNFVR